MLIPGPWQKTPRWQFWRPSHFRLAWRIYEEAPGMWIPYREYQSVEFVARDMIEQQFSEKSDGANVERRAPAPFGSRRARQ